MLETDHQRFRGEDLLTVDPEEARLWVEVYGELVRFLRRVGYEERTNRLRRLEARLALWQSRLAELSRT